MANIDMAPTLSELAGLAIPPELDGRFLAPLLQESGAWRDNLLLEGWLDRPYMAVTTGEYVYVEKVCDGPELYDLQADSHQLQNVVDQPEYASVAAQLRERLYGQGP